MWSLLLVSISVPQVVADLGMRDAEAVDSKLPVRATLPEGSGPFPVVIWSHIGGLSKDDYDPLVTAWAKRGYAVLQPTHRDSMVYATEDERKALGPGEGLTASNGADRIRQVRLILTRLPELNRTHPDLRGKLDATRVAVGGHGFGADTAMAVALNPTNGSRILAVLSFSPQRLPGEAGEPYKTLSLPTLLVSGDRDITPRDRRPSSWRRLAFDQLPAGDKHLLWLRDAFSNFGGIAGRRIIGGGLDNAAQVETVAAVTVGFLDAYVRPDAAAREALISGGIRLAAPAELAHR